MSATAATVVGGHGRTAKIYLASAAPTAENDDTNGHLAGDLWISNDGFPASIYVATYVGTGSAVWTRLSGAVGYGALEVQDLTPSGSPMAKCLKVRDANRVVIGYIELKPAAS